jgi:hypothetical protein
MGSANSAAPWYLRIEDRFSFFQPDRPTFQQVIMEYDEANTYEPRVLQNPVSVAYSLA